MVLRNDLSGVFWHFLQRPINPAVLDDVYDGEVFKNFQRTEKPHSADTWFSTDGMYELALQLNADAFQPFTKCQYSMTAVYAVVLNLPREIRYREENIILLGLIPGGFYVGMNRNGMCSVCMYKSARIPREKKQNTNRQSV
jgi:hypothetical protein